MFFIYYNLNFRVMKKLSLLLLTLLVPVFPILAQELMQTEDIPVETLVLKKGDIPPNIITAADKLFEGMKQVAWGKFPYQLKDYGWVVDKDYKLPIDHYEVQFKAKDGSDIYAVFEANGELVRYKVINRDAAPPRVIMNNLEKGPYKDWKIVGDVMRVVSNQKKVVEHYAIKVSNNGMTKNLYFTKTGDAITER